MKHILIYNLPAGYQCPAKIDIRNLYFSVKSSKIFLRLSSVRSMIPPNSHYKPCHRLSDVLTKAFRSLDLDYHLYLLVLLPLLPGLVPSVAPP